MFDGDTMHDGWVVLVRGTTHRSGGPAGERRRSGRRRRVVRLPGMTLMPGLIEGHSHLLLHPYNETTWNDQVLREPLAYRVARAVVHARATR